MDIGLLAQLLTNGVLTGGILALSALGLTLIFGVMDVVNFAHGTYVMLAMYAGYFAWDIAGIDPFVAALLVGPAFFVFGVISERLVIDPILDRPMYAQVFATVGLLWLFENSALFFWGPDPKSVTAGYGGINVASIAVEVSRLIGFSMAILVTGLLFVFLYRTKTGLAIRATAQSRDLAEPFGVDIDRIYMITFGLGIALVGVAGCAIIATRSVTPTSGNYFVLLAFVIVTLGGLNSISGTFLAGLFIGAADSFIGYFISPQLAPPIYFVFFISILVLRANGYVDLVRFQLREIVPNRGVSN
jgi:branched-chain amino acid transport system permease protein